MKTSEFRGWIHNCWVDNCDERAVAGWERLSKKEYWNKNKWWLRREWRKKKENDARRLKWALREVPYIH